MRRLLIFVIHKVAVEFHDELARAKYRVGMIAVVAFEHVNIAHEPVELFSLLV